MKFAVSKAELPGFQITPMLDVVFLLLCFFVTASVFSQWESQIDIQLPTAEAATAPEARLPGEIVVNIAKDGTISVNQREMTPEQLGEKLRILAVSFPGQPVTIRADRETRHGDVMRVLDACAGSDVWNISFAADSAGTGADDAQR
ncbi:MAG: biopolymer transporter ExbD [Kiritimatiellae bacterium]|nr:biopolymer transporter ExbD [Kiritimatiellia bacterium]